MFVNVWAKLSRTGDPIPTKKALKAALAEDPGSVALWETTMGREHLFATGDKLDPNARYTVVGPDPYRSRRWYATVAHGTAGPTVS